MTQQVSAPLDVVIREVTPQPYLGKRFHAGAGSVGPLVRDGFGELYHALAGASVPPAGMPFLIASEPKDGAMDVVIGAPCAAPPPGGALFAGTLPGGRVAVATHRGRYEELGRTYRALAEWIAANGHAMAGPPREAYLTGPDDVASPEDHVTEVIWPIA